MLYQHKETKKICDLVHSGPGYCVIIYLLKNDNILDGKSIYEKAQSPGKVFFGGKDVFKKSFKKISEDKALKEGYELVPEDIIKYTKDYCTENSFNIVHNTEEFVRRNNEANKRRKELEEKIEKEQKEIMDGYVEDGEVSQDEIIKTLGGSK